MFLGKRALKHGQLLRDLAWARLHLRVIAAWLAANRGRSDKRRWLASYAKVLMRFPAPVQA